MSERAADSVEAVFREEWGRLLATLIRWVGDIDLAEEVAADAMAVALERWPVDGVPDRPAAWLLTTARRRAVDLLRRRQTYARASILRRLRQMGLLSYEGGRPPLPRMVEHIRLEGSPHDYFCRQSRLHRDGR